MACATRTKLRAAKTAPRAITTRAPPTRARHVFSLLAVKRVPEKRMEQGRSLTMIRTGMASAMRMKFPVAKSPQLATTTPQLRTPEPCVFTRRVVNHARDRPTVQEPYWPMTTTTMACAMQMKSQAAKTAQPATTTPPLRMRLTASSLRAATNAKAIQRMGQDRSTTSTPITMASAMQMKLPVARTPQRATTMLLRRIPPRVYSPQAAMCAQAMRRTAPER